jgi:hypothetical protein
MFKNSTILIAPKPPGSQEKIKRCLFPTSEKKIETKAECHNFTGNFHVFISTLEVALQARRI